MTTRISKLFGMDIYQTDATYRGKVHDLIVNLEQGVIETITTQPLKVNSKIEAKKIITEHSIPYNKVISADDILLINAGNVPITNRKKEIVHNEDNFEEKSKEAAIRKKYIGYRSKYSRK
ncbi:MAG: PRC-barrel domain-containing protein [Candidatus ainarchaeum sp.]|nr:PRC-barrel domain-containing protein [Candidatus ainarchaeum sp.]MDD3975859.1 PRC-barrel domain-containing protein [Candidatus ainarchaeum sp.]